MLRSHAVFTFATVTRFVNSAVVFVSVALMGGAYFSALGQLAVA
ncbi:MAG: hypothetical protein ACKVS5_08745 [Parvularculaceae bacterium]